MTVNILKKCMTLWDFERLKLIKQEMIDIMKNLTGEKENKKPS